MTVRTTRNRIGAATAVAAALIVLLASCGLVGGRSTSPGRTSPTRDRTVGGRPAAARTDTPRSTSTASPSGPPYAVGVREISVAEPSRLIPTPEGERERVIPTVVRYPARTGRPGQDNPNAPPARGEFPLVVFAPGYRQCRAWYAPLLREWTAAGFVVAEVSFPLTNCHTPDPDEADIINQPFDVSSVITRLLADSAAVGPLHGLIDPRKVAVAGHSDGGDTVAAVAFNTCCRDQRVRAAVVLAGAELSSFGGSYFPPGSPPALFVQGTDDTVNPPADTLQLYRDDTTGPKALLSVDGAGHFDPYEGDGAAERLVARVTTDFLRAVLLGSASAARSMTTDGDVPGRSTLTVSDLPTPGSGSAG